MAKVKELPITAKLVSEIFNNASQSRLNFEKRWYLVDNFYENKHFLKSLRTTGQLVKQPTPKGIHLIPIPRAKKQMDTLINLMFTNDPRWQVYPIDYPVKDEKAIMNLQKALRVFWEVTNAKQQFKQAAYYAGKHNVGYVEVGMDENNNLFIDSYDSYNIYHEPNISSLDETHYLIKIVTKTLDEVRHSKLYKPEEVAKLKADYKYSTAEYKHMREVEKFGNPKEATDPRLKKVLLKEVWLKSGGKWWITTECQGHLLRDPVPVDYDLPFVAISLNKGELYQTSIVEDLIPLNKQIDIFMAYLERFIKTTAVGRLLEPAGSKVERVLDRNGERIRYQGSKAPQWLQSPNLNPAVMEYLNMMSSFMDERAVSVMAFGKVPTGIRAWRALESLKNIEFANLQTAIENLELAISKTAIKLIGIIEAGAMTPIPLTYQKDNSFRTLSLVSERAYGLKSEYQKDGSIIPVASKYRVKVEIEEGQNYTEEGKRELLLSMFKVGLVDKKEVLNLMKFSNVGDIIARVEKEQNEEIARQAVLQQLSGQSNTPNPMPSRFAPKSRSGGVSNEPRTIGNENIVQGNGNGGQT